MIRPKTPPLHRSVAPDVITSLMDITNNIYVVVLRGARPIFKPTSIDPGTIVSSRARASALKTTGGKGSHWSIGGSNCRRNREGLLRIISELISSRNQRTAARWSA